MNISLLACPDRFDGFPRLTSAFAGTTEPPIAINDGTFNALDNGDYPCTIQIKILYGIGNPHKTDLFMMFN